MPICPICGEPIHQSRSISWVHDDGRSICSQAGAAVAFDALRAHDAALIESLADDMESGFNQETLNLERRQIKRWLRERARQVREGQ